LKATPKEKSRQVGNAAGFLSLNVRRKRTLSQEDSPYDGAALHKFPVSDHAFDNNFCNIRGPVMTLFDSTINKM
jgi:hypothetical protein